VRSRAHEGLGHACSDTERSRLHRRQAITDLGAPEAARLRAAMDGGRLAE
jgi:hypothetical protein